MICKFCFSFRPFFSFFHPNHFSPHIENIICKAKALIKLQSFILLQTISYDSHLFYIYVVVIFLRSFDIYMWMKSGCVRFISIQIYMLLRFYCQCNQLFLLDTQCTYIQTVFLWRLSQLYALLYICIVFYFWTVAIRSTTHISIQIEIQRQATGDAGIAIETFRSLVSCRRNIQFYYKFFRLMSVIWFYSEIYITNFNV